MKCRDIIDNLEQLAPATYACEWDNPGLLAGRGDKEIKKILLALDATDRVVEQAVSQKADFLLTHHPLIFKPIKKINDSSFIGRRLYQLIRHDICYYAMHTNFDAAPGCMADLAAERLHLKNCRPLEIMGEIDGNVFGIGKIGMLEEEATLESIVTLVKNKFSLPFVTVFGEHLLHERVTRIAISPGSGSSMVSLAVRQQAQVLITGDIGHHTGIDAVADHMAVIDAGHYGLEYIFKEFMETYLRQTYGQELEIIQAHEGFPAVVR